MIGFRVDANERIATGHLMRCISIAEMCRKKGQEVIFILAEEKETERLKLRNFPYYILHSEWDAMEKEIDAMKAFIREKAPDCLVVDSYQVTTEYLKQMETVVPVLYIDDMEKELYPVSAVLHYGIGTEKEVYRKAYEKQNTKVYTGMGYIPLREEFMPVAQEEERRNSILITTGGTDPYQIARRLLEACLSYEGKEGAFFSETEFDVIIGALNHQREDLEKLATEYPQIKLHFNVPNMSDYMRSCKLAVSAGGTTLYELCACGIPTVCFSFADNQEPGTILFGKEGIMDYAGDARRNDVVGNMVKALLRLGSDDLLYKERQKKMNAAVDGRGAMRIAEVLTGGF